MKKLIACLVVLMLVSGCALAEPTNVLTFGILNPKITVNGEVALDLSRLDVETSLVYDGGDAIGVMLDVNAGPSFAVKVLSAQARWDDGKIVFSMDGANRLYNVDTPALLASSGASLRRALHPTDAVIPNIDLGSLSTEQRMALLEGILEPYVKDKTIVGEDKILSFDISQDEGKIIISGLAGILDQIMPTLGQNSVLALFGQDDGLGINLKGKLTLGPDGVKLDSDGSLITLKDGSIVPFVQSLTDDIDGFKLSIALGENQQGKLVVSGKRDQTTKNYEISLEQYFQDEMNATGKFTRTASDTGAVYVLDYAAANGQKLYAEVTDGLSGNTPSIALTANVTPDAASPEIRISADYDGQYIETDGQVAQGGQLKLDYDDGQSQYGFDGTVVFMKNGSDVRYAQWLKQVESSGTSVDLSNGTEQDTYQFETDLNVVFGSALTKLQNNVPGLSDLLSALQDAA